MQLFRRFFRAGKYPFLGSINTVLHPLASALQESHQDLQRWFLYHQECLLLNHDDYAVRSFQVFSHFLTRHIYFENKHLLAYLQQQAVATQWPLAVYQKEHEKLLVMLEKNHRYLLDYVQMQGREKRLALLELLDVQRSLRQLMEHHDEREEKDLLLKLPVLLPENILAQWQQINRQLQEENSVLANTLATFLQQA